MEQLRLVQRGQPVPVNWQQVFRCVNTPVDYRQYNEQITTKEGNRIRVCV